MESDKLVMMANQIASFFRPYSEQEAVAGIRDHIASFWTPMMRSTFAERLHGDRTGIEPLVVTAMLVPDAAVTGDSPVRRETQGPGKLGEMVTDAG